jgi:hypothetical protein
VLELSEKEWEAQLYKSEKGLAPMLGWKLIYHTLRSKGSQPGFPDRVLVRERIIFVESKSDTGKPTERQREWLTGIAKAGGEAYLWRPRDLDEVANVLGVRASFDPERGLVRGAYTHLPGSLWTAAGGRLDEQ